VSFLWILVLTTCTTHDVRLFFSPLHFDHQVSFRIPKDLGWAQHGRPAPSPSASGGISALAALVRLQRRLLGSCLKFVHVAPLTLRLRLRYAQGKRGRVCICTDSVHEPDSFTLSSSTTDGDYSPLPLPAASAHLLPFPPAPKSAQAKQGAAGWSRSRALS